MAELIARGRQIAAAYLKQAYGTEKGKRQLDTLLAHLLRPNRSFDEDVSNWCLWLIAGGQPPEEYLKFLRTLNSSPICGLVWNANFVAYRCRDCAISPCMSLCADCFQKGNHEGHDFNMFRSQAGGACDCGDESVMRSQGFCDQHNPNKKTSAKVVPDEYVCLAATIIPRLFKKLYLYFKDYKMSGELERVPILKSTDVLFGLLNKLSEVDALRDIMVDVILSKIPGMPLSSQYGNRYSGQFDLKPVNSPTNGRAIVRSIASSSSSPMDDFDVQSEEIDQGHEKAELFGETCSDIASSYNKQEENRTYIDFLMDTMVQLEFLNSLATFLLRLLPDQKYKVMFTRTFCQYYHEIGVALRKSSSPEDLSNRAVHVSVQLFSSEQLAYQMVKEEGLLESMCFVLDEMIRHCLEPYEYVVNGQASTVLVANCDSLILSKHCYWPVASDLINILSHKSVVEEFFKNGSIIRQWLNFTMRLTGMNVNIRRVLSHVEYESRTYYTSFSVEFESVAAVLWELHRGCAKLDQSQFCLKMIKEVTNVLLEWYQIVPSRPSRSMVTFHLALHRYLALFVSQASNHFKLDTTEFFPSPEFVAKAFEYPLRALVALYEVKAGYWVYNGHEMRCQAQSYVQSHFCNSMVDLDIFLVQMAAAVIDPDQFLEVLVDRFGLRNWFKFGKPDTSLPPRVDNIKESSMVEGLLNLIITLLQHRVYSGSTEVAQLRKDIATQLCIGDRTHSKLLDLIPGKPGDSHVSLKDFEMTLTEIANYKSPGFEAGGMQQGTYAPKDFVWDQEFDYNHIQLRCYARSDHQAALERYSSYCLLKGRTTTATCWPYHQKIEPIAAAYSGLLNLLHCKTLHKILFFILNKAVDDTNSVTDNMLISTIHLLFLCLDSPTPEKIQDFHLMETEDDAGLEVASKCLDFLETHARNERGLYSGDDLESYDTSTELLKLMMKDKNYVLDPACHSTKYVAITLLAAVFGSCYFSLFGAMIAYINNIFGEVLSPGSSLTNVNIRMDHLQYLLSNLPKSRYMFLERLLKHWIRASRRDGVPVQHFVFPIDDEERIGMSVLLKFLTKNFDWLFRIHIPRKGYPATAFDIEYPSSLITTNAATYVGKRERNLLQAATLEDGSALAPLEEEVPSALVEELMGIIECSRDRAIKLLRKYDNNIEFAVCMVIDGEEEIDMEVDEEISKAETDTGNAEGDFSSEEVASECIIGLLIQLRRNLLVQSRSKNNRTQRRKSQTHDMTAGDGPFYIENLLCQLCSQSSICAELVDKMCPSLDFHLMESSQRMSSEHEMHEKEARRKKAAERQRKLLAEFAERQKLFEDKNFSALRSSNGQPMDVDQTDAQSPSTEEYDCVICGLASPSSEERPFGLVVLMQPTTNLGHRHSTPVEGTLEMHSKWRSNSDEKCSGIIETRKDALLKTFEKVSAIRMLEVGLDCGVYIQTCGHYLHVDCQQSYYKALKEEQERDVLQLQPLIFNAERGYFTCPLCRQPSNGFLPILPDKLKQRNKEVESKSNKETSEGISNLLGKYAKKGRLSYLTARSLAFSILGAAYSTLSDSITTLLKEGGSLITSLYSDRTVKEKFSILVAATRANLELEYFEQCCGIAGHSARSTFLDALIEGLHFHSLSVENPMIDLWEQLKDPVSYDSATSLRSRPPLLLYDVTSLLLQFFLTWPNRFTSDEYFCLVQHLFNLCYCQAMVNVYFQLLGDERKQWEELGQKLKHTDTRADISTVLGFVASALSELNIVSHSEITGITQSVLSPRTIECTLQTYCVPFLRIATLLGNLQFGIGFPQASADVTSEFFMLTSKLSLTATDKSSNDITTSLDSCCISFPSCNWISAMKCWCRQLCTVKPFRDVSYKDMLPSSHFWPRPRLLPLPNSYDKLFDHYRKKQCNKCSKVPTDPTLCLVCGAFLCYRSPCCVSDSDVYECVQHSIDCGCGTGVFLVISSSVVLIIRFDRACIWGSVYLDSFGEEDRDLRRGKPLFLSQERFDRLEQQWLKHSFDRTCKRWGLHVNKL